VQLTWKAVNGADEYIVYRAKAKDAPYKKVITTTGTKYTNITGEAGKTYYYKVKAVSDDKKVENSEFSKVVKRTYDLSRPVVTAKSKTKKQVKLTWKKVDGAKKYVVYRATSKDGKYTKIATTTKTSYTNKKLKSGKTYYYKVKAIAKNSAANSACSVADKCKVR
jgi:fibronectin type 3 domain-containing protein